MKASRAMARQTAAMQTTAEQLPAMQEQMSTMQEQMSTMQAQLARIEAMLTNIQPPTYGSIESEPVDDELLVEKPAPVGLEAPPPATAKTASKKAEKA